MNNNFLQKSHYKLVIGSGEIDSDAIEYYALSATIPALTIGEIRVPYRKNIGYEAGEQIEYGPFDIELIIDENITVYKELYKWVIEARDEAERAKFQKDMELIIFSSHNNKVGSIRIINAWPSSIGSFEMTSRAADADPIPLAVTFRFDYFVIE